MGFMTEISILNDHWGEIRKDPATFVEQVYQSCASGGREPQYIIGQTTVAKTHHADHLQVYYAAGNSFFEAYPQQQFDRRRLEMHLKSLKQMKRYLNICERQSKNQLEAQGE